MDFSGKTAVVTGAGSGIGQAVCRRFIEHGAGVIACDLDGDAAARTLEGDAQSMTVTLNVADPEDWTRAAAALNARAATVDALVNCAGLARPGHVEDVALEDWRLQIDVNLTGTFLACRAMLPFMRESGRGGAIVNISSVGAVVASDDTVGYSAAKAGVIGLTKSVAVYGAAQRPPIRCNAVLPGYVDTPMMAPLAQLVGEETFGQLLAERVPTGAVSKPEEIAGVIVFLCSDAATSITGASLPIDGGILAAGAPPTVVVRDHLARRPTP